VPSKSKTKGKGFEREVATFLSNLYEDSFTRVPDSGAFTGGKNAHRREKLTEGQVRAHKGDIIPPDDWKRFNCECKNYAEFPFHQLFTKGPVLILESWIEQTLEAEDKGDVSIIFMKFNRKGKYVAYKLPIGFIDNRYLDYQDKQGNYWRITGFEDFFELNKDSFRDKCKGV
jgi:uncharacterized glyoxalase superfamily protein PhnB